MPPDVVLSCTLTRAEVDRWRRRVRDGKALRLMQGVYWPSPAQPPVTLQAGVVLATSPPGAVVSHNLAASLTVGLGRLPQAWHVTVAPETLVAHPRAEVTVHRAMLAALDTTCVDGLLVTVAVRTAFDLLASHAEADAVRWLEEQIQRGRLSAGDLHRLLTPGPRLRHGRVVARRAAAADVRSESWLETAARLLLVAGGCPPPELQWNVYDLGRFVARFDLAWPALKFAVEMDGRQFHAGDDAFEDDRARNNAAEGVLGWLVLHFTWKQVVKNPERFVHDVVRALALRQHALAA